MSTQTYKLNATLLHLAEFPVTFSDCMVVGVTKSREQYRGSSFIPKVKIYLIVDCLGGSITWQLQIAPAISEVSYVIKAIVLTAYTF